jgi:hypothetical protein
VDRGHEGGDWWGDTIYFDRAPSPVGPWTTMGTLQPTPLGSDHNTYFASFVRSSANDIVIGLSNNVWGGHRSDSYRPTFTSVPLSRWGPPEQPVTTPGAGSAPGAVWSGSLCRWRSVGSR